MTEQENIWHSYWRIIWLEQEKTQLYQEYIDKIAAINREIEQLRSKTSNARMPMPEIPNTSEILNEEEYNNDDWEAKCTIECGR